MTTWRPSVTSEDVIMHSAKGTSWGHHKYIAIKNGRYIYPSKATGRIQRGLSAASKIDAAADKLKGGIAKYVSEANNLDAEQERRHRKAATINKRRRDAVTDIARTAKRTAEELPGKVKSQYDEGVRMMNEANAAKEAQRQKLSKERRDYAERKIKRAKTNVNRMKNIATAKAKLSSIRTKEYLKNQQEHRNEVARNKTADNYDRLAGMLNNAANRTRNKAAETRLSKKKKRYS